MITRTLDELSDFEKLSIIPQSYSRLSTFEECEARYFFQYIMKEPDSTHPAALLGNVIHSVLEEQLQPNQEVTKELEPLLLKEFDLQLCIQDRDHIIDDDLELKGVVMLQEFVDRHLGETFEIVGKEQEFQIVVGTALFRGYIDRIDITTDGKIYIVDYKSGAREVSYKSIPTNLQLGVYALAVGRIFPDHDIYAEMYYLRTGRQKGHLFTRDDLESVEERLLHSVHKLIQKRDFKTTANFRACNYCPHAKSGACSVGVKRTTRRY